jgi:CMP-N-acetylneuraminic acid synthetase
MKGNSERVPNKNLKNFLRKPLYHRVLNVLLESKYIDTVIVNTDCDKIKKDLKLNYSNKVIIHERPDSIIGDYVSMNKIIEYDLSKLNSDIYIQTHSTNPILLTKTIDSALEKFFTLKKKNKYDSIFSVTRTQKRFYDQNSLPLNHDPNMLVTQHLNPIFEENSCFYIFSKESFLSNSSRIGFRPFMYEIDKIESIDIDDKDDFIIAEAIFNLLRNKK